MEGMKDWETVDESGTLKRFKIDGGWVYALVDWVTADPTVPLPIEVHMAGGYWRIVNGFFVEERG